MHDAYAPPSWRLQSRVVENLAMAVCYYGLGKLALSLAIPPGLASAVWPPAGLALAGMLAFRYRVWPGILVGHFLVNLFPSSGASLAPDSQAFLALMIAIGGTLQAALGAFLTRRFVGYPNRLEQEKDILFFLLLGGPVSCTVSATFGTTSLLLLGELPARDYPFHWFTWWAGDIIGVILVAPVLIIWAAGREVPLRRKLSVTGLLMVMLALVVLFFVASSASEKRLLALDFKSRTETPRSAIEKRLAMDLELTKSVADYFMSGSAITATDFRHFFKDAFAQPHRGIHALGWYPRVDDAERSEFEEAARRDGMPAFEIKQLDPDGLLTRAARRSEYFPARQLEPHKAREALLGFDLGSQAVSLEAVNRARDRGMPVISAPVRFLLESTGPPGVLIVAPAYTAGATPVSMEQRRREFMGVAVWLVSVSHIVEDALKGVPHEGIEIRIEDKSEPAEVLLYDSGVGAPKSATAATQLQTAQHLGARNWMLTFYPTRQYALAQGWLSWAFLIGGLLLTSLLSAFFIGVTGHSAAVQRLVSERTAALEAANQELESFSYSVAHDLRSPLTVVLGFSRCLSNSSREKLDPKSRQYLDGVMAGSMRMTSLIEDLLNLSRVSRAQLCAEQINLSELAAGIVADFRMRDPSRQVVIEIADGLTALCDKGLIKVALENLLSNAWKFTAKKPDARITFCLDSTPHESVFCVRDNGAGFDMKSAGKLFSPFQRLHPASEFEGTGIGLATVARIISRHGGRIWVNAEINEGASFFFTLAGRGDLPADGSKTG